MQTNLPECRHAPSVAGRDTFHYRRVQPKVSVCAEPPACFSGAISARLAARRRAYRSASEPNRGLASFTESLAASASVRVSEKTVRRPQSGLRRQLHKRCNFWIGSQEIPPHIKFRMAALDVIAIV